MCSSARRPARADDPRSEGHSGLRSRISAYFVTVPDRHAQPCYLHAGHPLPVESPDILHNGHRYRHVPFLPERRPAATGRIKTDWQLGNIQAAAPMPITSPGNDDDTGENHQPHCGKTLPVNKHRSKTLEPGLRRRSRRPLPAGRADSPRQPSGGGPAHADLDQTVEDELLLLLRGLRVFVLETVREPSPGGHVKSVFHRQASPPGQADGPGSRARFFNDEQTQITRSKNTINVDSL